MLLCFTDLDLLAQGSYRGVRTAVGDVELAAADERDDGGGATAVNIPHKP